MSRQMQAKSLYDVSGQDLHKNIRVLDLRMDSRLVQKDDLFFALSLDAKQRAQHIDQAVSQGCSAVVVDAGAPLFEHGVLPVVAIKNLRSALGEIANNFYDQPSSQGVVVGITGTNGKTSCSHWMAQAWSAVAGSAAFMGTLGSSIIENGVETTSLQSSGLTTADVLSNHRVLTQIFSSGAKMVAMEVSSHALDQGRVDGVGFDTAVFSNLTRDHLDYHGDMERYGQAKQQLFLRPDLKHAIVNIDDVFGQYLLKIIAEKNSGVRRLSYAVADKTADICVQSYSATGRGIHALVRTPWGEGELCSNSPGEFNLLNSLAVLAVLCSHGLAFESALTAIKQLRAVSGRTQIVSEVEDDVLVVVDYAHTPDALQKILHAMRPQTGGKLWCVFGCGGERDAGKRPQMGAIAESFSDVAVITDDNPRNENSQNIIDGIIAGFKNKNFHVERDRSRAIQFAIHEAAAADVVLIAGKGHESYQDICGKKLPFLDESCAKLALRQRKNKQLRGVAHS